MVKKKVVRVDKSPMNPKLKCVELECGHEIWVSRAPTVGKLIECETCTKAADAPVVKNKARRSCFMCDGSGQKCDCCGESSMVCECEDDDRNFVDCEDCNGHGIASADLTEEEKKS